MDPKVVIDRPVAGPLQVIVQPMKGSRDLLRSVLPERSRVTRDDRTGWNVARTHLAAIVEGMTALGWPVQVRSHYSTKEACTVACQAASNPHWECVCRCGGRRHAERRELVGLHDGTYGLAGFVAEGAEEVLRSYPAAPPMLLADVDPAVLRRGQRIRSGSTGVMGTAHDVDFWAETAEVRLDSGRWVTLGS